MMKRFVGAILTVFILAGSLISCGGDGAARLLSFSEAQSIEEMQKLDGKQVSIIGYMSTLSPISGKFMYLMNLPYQSCPFCIPNTSQLSNTMAVYAKGSDEFEFTDRAIQVTGTLEFGDYTDEFGYEYSYRIKDATYTVLDLANMSEELRLWQQLASTDVVADIYTMFEYVNFLCYWPTYTANFEGSKDYVYAKDAIGFIETEGAQFNYGFKEGYFENIITTIEGVDKNAFSSLADIVRDAKAISDKAYSELKAEKYIIVNEYSATFGDGRQQYKMDISEELASDMRGVYSRFSAWLAEWEI